MAGAGAAPPTDRLTATPMLSLVTGASGFVGQAIVRRLLADGHVVRALVLPGDRRLPELRALGAADRLAIIEADTTSYDAIAPYFAGVARVFHTAAIVHGWHPWERYRAVNVGGTQNVARAALANGVARFVHVSTSDVFGIPREDEVINESTPYREWHEPYPDTKIEAQRWLWQFHRESGLPIAGGMIGIGGEMSWPQPTRPGDILTVVSEVEEVIPSRSRPDRGTIRVRSETRNQRDEVVQILTARLLVPRRPVISNR